MTWSVRNTALSTSSATVSAPSSFIGGSGDVSVLPIAVIVSSEPSQPRPSHVPSSSPSSSTTLTDAAAAAAAAARAAAPASASASARKTLKARDCARYAT